MEQLIQVQRLSYGSAAIAHTAAGKTVFVEGGVPGDLVKIAIDEEKPRYARAHITELVEASRFRVAGRCSACASCGACPWQHIDYVLQVEAKRAHVVDSLVHTARTDRKEAESKVQACLPSKRQWGYRNKLELSARTESGKLLLGLFAQGSSSIITIDSCPLAHAAIEDAPKALRGALNYLQGNQDLKIFRVGLRHSLRTNDLEVALWTEPGPFPRAGAAKTVKSALKTTSIVRVIADPGKARSVKQVEVLDGKGYWEDRLDDRVYKTSAPSFFQVNTAQAELMVREVLAGLSQGGRSSAADLYAGGGTFSIPLAEHFDRVYAIESASSSIRDLRRNAEAHAVSLDIIGGDSARELPLLGHLDALVVDPPRAGLAEDIVGSIAKADPEQVAYVSCNPATWARDIARFTACGYLLEWAQPVDLFPQTYHVEIVSLLKKAKGR